MLIITLEPGEAIITFRLDGRLEGPGVRELARNWSLASSNGPRRRASFDLGGVTSIDEAGRTFLANACRQGHRLVAGARTKALVAEIRATVQIDPA